MFLSSLCSYTFGLIQFNFKNYLLIFFLIFSLFLFFIFTFFTIITTSRGESYQYLLPDVPWNQINTIAPISQITPSTNGIASNCPPSGSYEKCDLVLHNYEHRSKAAAIHSLLSLSLHKIPRLTDRGLRLILSRTPNITSLSLSSMSSLIDPFSSINGIFSIGEDGLVNLALLNLTSISLICLHSLKGSVGTAFQNLYGTVDDNQDEIFRTTSRSKLHTFIIDDLPLWPSTMLAETIRCFPLLITFKASRMSFDGRVLRNLDWVCKYLVSVELNDLKISERPRLHAAPLAKFLKRRCDTLRVFVMSGINYQFSKGEGNGNDGNEDANDTMEGEADDNGVKYNGVKYIHYSNFSDFLMKSPGVMRRIKCGDICEQFGGVLGGRSSLLLENTLSSAVDHQSETKQIEEEEGGSGSKMYSLKLLKQKQKEKKKSNALNRATNTKRKNDLQLRRQNDGKE